MKSSAHSKEAVTDIYQNIAASYTQNDQFDRNVLLKFFDSIEIFIADQIDVQLFRSLYAAIYRIPDKNDGLWIDLFNDTIIVVSAAVANKMSSSHNASEFFRITQNIMRLIKSNNNNFELNNSLLMKHALLFLNSGCESCSEISWIVTSFCKFLLKIQETRDVKDYSTLFNLITLFITQSRKTQNPLKSLFIDIFQGCCEKRVDIVINRFVWLFIIDDAQIQQNLLTKQKSFDIIDFSVRFSKNVIKDDATKIFLEDLQQITNKETDFTSYEQIIRDFFLVPLLALGVKRTEFADNVSNLFVIIIRNNVYHEGFKKFLKNFENRFTNYLFNLVCNKKFPSTDEFSKNGFFELFNIEIVINNSNADSNAKFNGLIENLKKFHLAYGSNKYTESFELIPIIASFVDSKYADENLELVVEIFKLMSHISNLIVNKILNKVNTFIYAVQFAALKTEKSNELIRNFSTSLTKFLCTKSYSEHQLLTDAVYALQSKESEIMLKHINTLLLTDCGTQFTTGESSLHDALIAFSSKDKGDAIYSEVKQLHFKLTNVDYNTVNIVSIVSDSVEKLNVLFSTETLSIFNDCIQLFKSSEDLNSINNFMKFLNFFCINVRSDDDNRYVTQGIVSIIKGIFVLLLKKNALSSLLSIYSIVTGLARVFYCVSSPEFETFDVDQFNSIYSIEMAQTSIGFNYLFNLNKSIINNRIDIEDDVDLNYSPTVNNDIFDINRVVKEPTSVQNFSVIEQKLLYFLMLTI
jgi:hypothetical protein